MWSLNVDSLPNKMVELQTLASTDKPDIITVTEATSKTSRYNIDETDTALQGKPVFTEDLNQDGHGASQYTIKLI